MVANETMPTELVRKTSRYALAALSGILLAFSWQKPVRAGVNQPVVLACGGHDVRVEAMASDLEHPWGLAFVREDVMLVSERPGRLRLVRDGVLLEAPVMGLPEIEEIGQGGLLDVAVDPDYRNNKRIYLSYAEPGRGGYGTAVLRGRLTIEASGARLLNIQVIYRQSKKTRGTRHFGSRLVFATDGTLFITNGERGDPSRAQDPFDHAGSVLRINPDGSIPEDNPFADGDKALPEIWSIGHRNAQGAALHPQSGALWTLAHGPRGGDELNIARAGKNYGWPVISYGRHYTGFRVGVGTHKAGLEQPIHYWDPSIAPSGLAFYTGKLFPKWRGSLFAGALKYRQVRRLTLRGDAVVSEESCFKELDERIRDIRMGPQGALWLLTDAPDGQLLRLTPAP